MTTDSANSERERLLKRLDHVVAAWVPHSDLCRDAAQQIRADATELTSLRACVSRKDEEIAGLRAALERIGGMSVRFTCACGRPTGTGAIKTCADNALAAQPSGRCAEGREEGK